MPYNVAKVCRSVSKIVAENKLDSLEKLLTGNQANEFLWRQLTYRDGRSGSCCLLLNHRLVLLLLALAALSSGKSGCLLAA